MADWTPELTLNDELLDPQHVELFRRLADAAAALDGTPEQANAAVAAFGDALVGHLTDEERLMEESLYPERIRHRSAHELFVVEFEQMRAELRVKGATPLVADSLRRRIPEWLRFHIRVNDAPFGAWLARRRPQPPEARGRKRDQGRRLS
jgi:hemerythrin